MNDLFRLLRLAVRPFGYDVRRRESQNLLPCKGIASPPPLTRVRAAFDGDLIAGNPDAAAAADLDSLTIILRTCLTAERSRRDKDRIDAIPITTVAEVCFRSLVASVNHARQSMPDQSINLIILDDHSDTIYLDRLSHCAKTLQCAFTVEKTELTGQGPSLRQQFGMARRSKGMYYFCEDDYIHQRSAIVELVKFYKTILLMTGSDLVLHPQEHEFLYQDRQYPSYLLLGESRHWRSCADATHVLFTHARVVDRYWPYFENTKFVGDRKRRRLGSERNTTNRLFDHLPGFAPIPALAGHLQNEKTLPPFFDWRSLWAANAGP